MLIQTTQNVLDYESNPIPNGEANGEPKFLTVRDVLGFALNNYLPSEQPTPDDKATSFALSSALFAGPTLELTVEQAAFVKTRVGIVGSPLQLGRITALIENAAQIPAIEADPV